MLALGLLTPLATAALSGVMVTAIRTVHLRNGPWVTNGGYEYNAVLQSLLMGLADDGPGKASLDSALGIERSGARWAWPNWRPARPGRSWRSRWAGAAPKLQP